MNEDAKALYEQMQSTCLNQEVGPYRAWDKVNRPMIRHWCDAMGDSNPIYTDPEAAAACGFGGVVAPPTMLQAWTMRGYGDQWAPGSTDQFSFRMFSLLEAAGYPAVVAVNCEQEYHRYLEEGDDVYHTSQIESVSEEKSTALGVGFFITELSHFYNQRDELVAEMRFRVFKYRPHEAAQPAPAEADGEPAAPSRFRPVRNWDTRFFWEGVDAGKLLIQRCKQCETLRHPPGPMCPHCQSLEWDTVQSSGRGVVYSYVVMHHPPIPPFDYPNPVVLVELEEGTRLISQLEGVKPADIQIGMPVEVIFENVEEGLTLPLFRPQKG